MVQTITATITAHPLVCTAAGALVLVLVSMIFLFSHATAAPSRYNIDGRVFIVTGGSSGVGLAVARQLVRRGAASVAIMARNEKKLQDAKALLLKECKDRTSQNVFVVSVDVSNAGAAQKAIDTVVQLNDGRLDTIICCAGTAIPGHFLDLPVDSFRRQMDVNYLGTVYCVRAAVPHLYRQAAKDPYHGARVLMTSSIAGLIGVFGYTAYAPSKFALRGFAETLHTETSPHHVLVSLIVPPDVDTPGYREEIKKTPRETLLMSAGTGVFHPDAVATSVMEGLVRWRFFISTGFDSSVMSMVAAVGAPAHSSLSTLMQLCFTGVVRFVMLGYALTFANIAIREKNARAKKKKE